MVGGGSRCRQGEILLLGVWFHACSLGAAHPTGEALAKRCRPNPVEFPSRVRPRDRDERRASWVTSSAPPSSGQGSLLKRRWAYPRSRQRESCVIHPRSWPATARRWGWTRDAFPICVRRLWPRAVACQGAGVTTMLPTPPGHAPSSVATRRRGTTCGLFFFSDWAIPIRRP